MKVSLYVIASGTFAPVLHSLSALLEKAGEHAAAKGIDPAVLVNARLAPDMLPLVRQVQIACDHAKNVMARLAGIEAKSFADNEQTLEDLHARIAATIDYIETIHPSALDGAEDRQITIPLPKDFVVELDGIQCLRDWALPNFYFHVVTAYDILRHNGVVIGKRDFLAHVGGLIKPKG